MKLNPRNRFIILESVPTPTTEETPTILVPEEYTTHSNPYGVYQIAQLAEDCVKVTSEDLGKYVVVNDTMVETASLDQGNFLLVLENHVYGVLEG